MVSGKNDCGIDAVYIEEGNNDQRDQVYLIQAKYHRNEEKYDRNLHEEALMKMQGAISQYVLRNPKKTAGINEMLLQKLKDIRSLTNPKINIIFFSNGGLPGNNAQEKFDDFIASKKGSGEYFDVKYVSLLQIASALRPKTRRRIDTKLRLSGKYFDWTIGGVEVVVGRVSGKEIARLRREQGDELFDKNVRGYLKLRNQVNLGIFETASDSAKAPNFFFLNNGITVVCSNVTFLKVDESPELEIKDLQIVNGGQTTNAIYEAENKGMLSDNAYLLVRIVQTNDQKLLDLITEATNTQTSVKSRDLHSNDQVQRTLERILLSRGFYYESRANKYKDNPAARGKRIDMVIAAQALYAFLHKRPADAKNKRRDLTGPLYYEIFNETTKPEDLLFTYKALEYVRGMHSEFIEKFSFVRYAEFHSLTMLGEVGLHNFEYLNKEDTKRKYSEILEATKVVVDEEVRSKGENYSHRALFINQTTIGRIKEEYFKRIK